MTIDTKSARFKAALEAYLTAERDAGVCSDEALLVAALTAWEASAPVSRSLARFVARHTHPERVLANGLEATVNILTHHPEVVKERGGEPPLTEWHAPTEADQDGHLYWCQWTDKNGPRYGTAYFCCLEYWSDEEGNELPTPDRVMRLPMESE